MDISLGNEQKRLDKEQFSRLLVSGPLGLGFNNKRPIRVKY